MTLTVQFYTMLAMIMMGSWLGLSLETYKRLFNRKKHRVFLVFINDFLFWLFQALLIFYILYSVNRGELRFYIFLALLCGFAAYQSLIKPLYLPLLEKGIQLSLQLYRFFERIITIGVIRPIAAIFTFLFSVLLFIGRAGWRFVRLIARLLLALLRYFSKPFSLLGIFLWNHLSKSFKMKESHFIAKLKKKIRAFFNRLKKKK